MTVARRCSVILNVTHNACHVLYVVHCFAVFTIKRTSPAGSRHTRVRYQHSKYNYGHKQTPYRSSGKLLLSKFWRHFQYSQPNDITYDVAISQTTLMLDSCLIYAWLLPAPPAHRNKHCTLPRPRLQRNEQWTGQWQISCQVVVWVRSFIEPDLFYNNVPFDTVTIHYSIGLLLTSTPGSRLVFCTNPFLNS